jgi:hypothetical protein
MRQVVESNVFIARLPCRNELTAAKLEDFLLTLYLVDFLPPFGSLIL